MPVLKDIWKRQAQRWCPFGSEAGPKIVDSYSHEAIAFVDSITCLSLFATRSQQDDKIHSMKHSGRSSTSPCHAWEGMLCTAWMAPVLQLLCLSTRIDHTVN